MTNRRYGFYLTVLGSSFSAFSVLGLRVLCSLCLQGLINDVQKVFPDAEHRFCVRHLLQNFQRAGHRGETLKNDLWAIARSTHLPKWQKKMWISYKLTVRLLMNGFQSLCLALG